MPADRGASTNGQAPSVEEGVSARSELDELRVTCRRQASVIDVDRRRAGPPAALAVEDTDLTEVHLRLDTQAPAAARAIVATVLRHRLAAPTFDRVQLLASELVSNGVLHSGASEEAVLVFRLEFSQYTVRLEVEDPGHHGAVAPRPARPRWRRRLRTQPRATAERALGSGTHRHRRHPRLGVRRARAALLNRSSERRRSRCPRQTVAGCRSR